MDGPKSVNYIICKGAATMRRGHGDQGSHVNSLGLKSRDQVTGIQAAHAVGYDVHALPLGFCHDILAKFGGPLLYRSAWRHRSRDNFDALRCQGIFDTMPVVDCGKV